MEQMKYPRGERVWLGYYDSKKRLRYIITSKESRDFYWLYEAMPDGSFRKFGKSRSPAELGKKYMESIGR